MVQQTPWFERKFNLDFPVGLLPVFLERLRGTEPHIRAMLKDAPEALLINKPNNDWSIKEHVGHLYDLESLWYGRVDDYLAGVPTLRAADLRNTKTHEANHNLKSLEELLILFAHARNALVLRAEEITEEDAARVATHPRLNQPMRLVDTLFFVAEHDDHHLTKIRELLRNRQ